MRTVRTVRKVVEVDEELRQKPKFSVGDYLRIYSGSYENHSFWVKEGGIRYNHDIDRFEYLYGVGVVMGGWERETNLELVRRAALQEQGGER